METNPDQTMQQNQIDIFDLMPKKTYQKPVKSELIFYHEPTDINHFITGIFPNMECIAQCYLRTDTDDHQTAINSFVAYILGFSKSKNVQRYRIYDPIRFPNQPYFKWWLVQFKYFLLNYKESRRKISFREVPMVAMGDYQSSEDLPTGCMTEDQCSTLLPNPIEDLNNSILLSELDAFLEQYSTVNASKGRFHKNAHFLFRCKCHGYQGGDIARTLNISESAVSIWVNRMLILCNDFVEGSAYT